MSGDLKALLGYQTLTEPVKVFFDQSKNRRIQKEVFKKKEFILGDTASWYQITASREPAPFVSRNGAAVKVGNLGAEKKTSSPATIILSKEIMGHELFREGWPTPGRVGPGLQLLPNAAARIDDEKADLMNRIGAAVEVVCYQALQGSIAINATNFPGSKVNVAVSYGGVQTLAGGGAYWSDSTKKLITGTTTGKPVVPEFKRLFRENTGLELGKIMLNYKAVAELQACTEFQNLVRGSIPGAPVVPNLGMLNQALASEGFVFDEYSGTYTVNGTVTRFITDGTVVGLPSGGDEYFQMHEGYGVIPMGAGVIGTEGSELGLMRLEQPGIWAYAVLNPRPPISVELFMGYTFLPVLAWDKAVVYATIDS